MRRGRALYPGAGPGAQSVGMGDDVRTSSFDSVNHAHLNCVRHTVAVATTCHWRRRRTTARLHRLRVHAAGPPHADRGPHRRTRWVGLRTPFPPPPSPAPN